VIVISSPKKNRYRMIHSFFQYSSEGEEEEDVLADPSNIGYKTKPKKVNLGTNSNSGITAFATSFV
jgi:hypothetical protein